ncbi:hypothetical protein PR048_011562 [Dryococelus australis]|uniref:MADF domain-containing protein n=1 Tax=Dryococelus australis TaxID=614101 RepID=A0ABQ9HM34_9NEOP|nr:hypothetical protein PR048_011562 [Dryococelus australis]
MEWSSDSVLRMLDEYQKYPVLFNTKSPLYHNKNLRQNALESIAAAVSEARPNTTAEDFKNKLRNLFGEQIVSVYIECTISPATGEVIANSNGVEEETSSPPQNCEVQQGKVNKTRKRANTSTFNNTSMPEQSQTEKVYKIIAESLQAPPSTSATYTTNQRLGLS